MTKEKPLKTLKDLFYLDGTTPTREQLKAEAIKWVKSLREKDGSMELIPDAYAVMMEFFNITEEDLK